MTVSAELIFITYFFNLTCQAIFNRFLGSSQNCAVGGENSELRALFT